MQTVSLLVDYPPKGQTKMAGKKLVRGNDRRNVQALLKRIRIVENRDGKVSVQNDPGNFKGQLVFTNSGNPGLNAALNKVKQRLLDLLAQQV